MNHHLSLSAAVLAALALAPAAAIALDAKSAVDTAKTAGIVGEQADGFLGFVKPSSDPATKAAVDDINAGRAALYREAAAKNGDACGRRRLGLHHRGPGPHQTGRVLQARRRRLDAEVTIRPG